ncbi:MAG: murein biosynthesis integral membrane protein MurJ [Candidatus Omnitrophica bacterium]|nr:murein biosynthesis integral membrane protein MurJ [Candidatus Omnitrophota bacterium]MBU4479066.1 murein biosynthesis integral membrane protein MurJ [Candidatus Omnitrophota bacterium]MCG2703091.1 murein biosynthesis integral membrane protein MurJ [Candidatus Omnitrophota bacterium]
MSEHKKLFRSAGVVSFFTLLSRILGFLRDIIIAGLFGTGTAAEAFVVAFRIPNTLRHLIGEGATNAAVIPILSEYLETDNKEEFWRVAHILLNLLVVILVLISIAGIIFAPGIVRIIAFGFGEDAAKLALTIKLTRVMFSFIFFIGLTAYLMGVLNTLKHFAAPAASSCFLNISMIFFGLCLCGRFKEPVVGMAIAVLIGGFLQFIVQVPILMKKGFRLIFPLRFYHPAIKRITGLLLPRIVGSSIYQINIFIDTMFASLGSIVGQGAVAVLYFAHHLVQFPTALFGTAMATASLPTMSRQAIANDLDSLKKTLEMSLRTMLILLIPSTVGLFVLARPIIRALFEHGKFDAASTNITSLVLMSYCVGLFAYSGARVTTSCFYALRDTVTPVKITFGCLVINIIFNVMLMFPLKACGLALATSISSSVNFFLLIAALRAKIGALGLRSLVVYSGRIIIASAFMGAACLLGYYFFFRLFKSTALSLSAAIICGMLTYLLSGWRLGIFKGLRWRYGTA